MGDFYQSGEEQQNGGKGEAKEERRQEGGTQGKVKGEVKGEVKGDDQQNEKKEKAKEEEQQEGGTREAVKGEGEEEETDEDDQQKEGEDNQQDEETGGEGDDRELQGGEGEDQNQKGKNIWEGDMRDKGERVEAANAVKGIGSKRAKAETDLGRKNGEKVNPGFISLDTGDSGDSEGEGKSNTNESHLSLEFVIGSLVNYIEVKVW